MSGLEVAGVVLGVFPLVVSGLRFYYEGCEKVKGSLSPGPSPLLLVQKSVMISHTHSASSRQRCDTTAKC